MLNYSNKNSPLNRLSEDGHQRYMAQQMFQKQIGISGRKSLMARLTGKNRTLMSLNREELPSNGRSMGVQLVRIAEIRGTENRSSEFDHDFLPTEDHIEQRWMSVASAMMRGVSLPPVDLILVDDVYYVRDGHHRISVMRALGFEEVEATVTVYQ